MKSYMFVTFIKPLLLPMINTKQKIKYFTLEQELRIQEFRKKYIYVREKVEMFNPNTSATFTFFVSSPPFDTCNNNYEW